jgi:hypothetical protein
MNKNLEEIYKKNIRDLQEQNRNLMVRVKMLTDELYELKTNKKFKGKLYLKNITENIRVRVMTIRNQSD